MLDVRRLGLLHAFAQHGSIASTAAALGYSPSAVSQQLATLEREAGTALLDRTARSATLTDAGRLLAGHAGSVLAAVEAAESDLAAAAGQPSGRVVIYAVPTAAVHLATRIVAVRRRHRAVEPVLRQASGEEALARLRAREADIAVVDDWTQAPATAPRGLRVERLLTDPVVLAVPRDHPLGGRRRVELRAWTGERWICAPRGEPSREAFDRILAAAGATPATLWEFEGLATIATLVSQGAGIALLPRLAVTGSLRGRVAARHLPGRPARSIDLVTRSAARRRPAVDVTLRAMARRAT